MKKIFFSSKEPQNFICLKDNKLDDSDTLIKCEIKSGMCWDFKSDSQFEIK